jgi:heterogeneous nuclear ribonucleoprotein K
MAVPYELGGTILGKGGERMNNMRNESGAKINLTEQYNHEDRILTISGTPHQIQRAQYLLQQRSIPIYIL